MRRQSGFTLVEIVVVIAILGILGATAVPVFRTWQMRAHGTEATVMARQILDAQIVYYMEHDKFYPPDDTTRLVLHDDPQDAKDIELNLNIVIPSGHFLNYAFQPLNIEGDEQFTLEISTVTGYKIFKDAYGMQYIINKKGEITVNKL